MKVVVGLGNPGKEFKGTRHNVGFMVLEEIASRHPVQRQDTRFDAILGHTQIAGQNILLVKPLTYMNLSGKTVQALVRWYKLNLDDLLIVHDDMDLGLGAMRMRKGGGSGGHRGLSSIITGLGSEEIPRLRLGIGRPEAAGVVGWVLGRFNKGEEEEARSLVKRAADAVEKWINSGIEAAMNTYN